MSTPEALLSHLHPQQEIIILVAARATYELIK